MGEFFLCEKSGIKKREIRFLGHCTGLWVVGSVLICAQVIVFAVFIQTFELRAYSPDLIVVAAGMKHQRLDGIDSGIIVTAKLGGMRHTENIAIVDEAVNVDTDGAGLNFLG